MKKLIVLCGISGSGKSYFARTEWEKDPLNTLVVSRDTIRYMFGFTEESVKDYYSRAGLSKLEKQVTLYEDTLIHEGLNLNKTVIVDATHLTVAYLKRFEFWNVPIEYKYFDITLAEAIERDSKRNRRVGAEVIKKQYNKFRNLERLENFTPVEFVNDRSKPSVWVFDIDNTIAHKGDRNAYDWKAVGKDTVDEPVSRLFKIIDTCDHVIFCSGRDEICRKETEEWLKTKISKYSTYTLLMRPEKDQRADWIVKEELWREIAKDYYIEALIDDRNSVVRRGKSLGLKVFQVEYGNF